MNIENRIDLMDGRCDKNVIAVDWSGGSKTLLYPQAVANTQMVGASIAKLIKQLIKLSPSGSPDNFTVLGHSLGSHISGFVGTHFQKVQFLFDNQKNCFKGLCSKASTNNRL